MVDESQRVSDWERVKVLGTSEKENKLFVHLELDGQEQQFELDAERTIWDGFSIFSHVSVPADLSSAHAEAGIRLTWDPGLSPRLKF